MNLFVIGVNYKIASVSVREKFSILPENQKEALMSLLSDVRISEAVIISTCNRTEIYAFAESDSFIKDWFFNYNHADVNSSCLYSYKNIDAVMHLFRVSSGLDSQIIGEVQILGQIKLSYKIAKECGAINSYLDKLFQMSFSAAKKIRCETKVGDFHVSIANSAVFFAKQIFGDIKNHKALLIGSGETIVAVAKYLNSNGIGNITIANRTYVKAQKLANSLGAEAIPLLHAAANLADADIVITATGSSVPILGKGMFEVALIKRKQRPMFVLDLAVPRDIEEAVGDLSEVFLYTIDDIKLFVNKNLEERLLAAKSATPIIKDYSLAYMDWLTVKIHSADIVSYRNNSHLLKKSLINKFKKDLSQGADPQIVLEQFGDKLTNKLIHNPTQILNKLISSNYPDKSVLLEQFLKLNLPED